MCGCAALDIQDILHCQFCTDIYIFFNNNNIYTHTQKDRECFVFVF